MTAGNDGERVHDVGGGLERPLGASAKGDGSFQGDWKSAPALKTKAPAAETKPAAAPESSAPEVTTTTTTTIITTATDNPTEKVESLVKAPAVTRVGGVSPHINYTILPI